VGLVDGAAYPAQFADAKVQDERLSALRRRVKYTVDSTMGEDAVKLVLTMKDGSKIEQAVSHATGSPENPMTDEALAGKFMTLASETLGGKDAGELLDRLWHLDEAKTIAGLVP
jgi:2-methylcitrate dehydratase PrpD